MPITVFSENQITPLLKNSPDFPNEFGIKVLFSPVSINNANIDQVSNLYKAIQNHPFDTFVILEDTPLELDKKIPMPSADYFDTPMGRVRVNDGLRNDFADEEDDFYIDDSAFNQEMSLFQQLMMLKHMTTNDFDVVSIQISDQRPAIIRELSWVMSEILSIKNACVIACCELMGDKMEDFAGIQQLVYDDNVSGLFNFVNSDSLKMNGKGAFLAGVLTARAWELDIRFLNWDHSKYGNNLISGYAGLTRNKK